MSDYRNLPHKKNNGRSIICYVLFFHFFICISRHYIINQLFISPIILVNLIIIQLINKSGWAKPTYFYFFVFFCSCWHKCLKVCTKSLGFLRATKIIKIVCSFVFWGFSTNVSNLVQCQKTKVQTPIALKNAKLVRFSTKDCISFVYSFLLIVNRFSNIAQCIYMLC